MANNEVKLPNDIVPQIREKTEQLESVAVKRKHNKLQVVTKSIKQYNFYDN